MLAQIAQDPEEAAKAHHGPDISFIYSWNHLEHFSLVLFQPLHMEKKFAENTTEVDTTLKH